MNGNDRLRERQIAEFTRMRDDAAQAMLGLPSQLESTVQWKINCYDAAIAALLAQEGAAAPEGESWQPIATAPKDGSLVIIGAPGCESVSARWGWESPWIDGWWCDGHRSDAEGPHFTPTHWHPLPTLREPSP